MTDQNKSQESEYLKEPWTISCLHKTKILDSRNQIVTTIHGDGDNKAIATRIVACVNFVEWFQKLIQSHEGLGEPENLHGVSHVLFGSFRDVQKYVKTNAKVHKENHTLKSRAEQAEQKLAKAMKAKEWVRYWGPFILSKWQTAGMGDRFENELREILNEKEGM
jgi:hypothetical protein